MLVVLIQHIYHIHSMQPVLNSVLFPASQTENHGPYYSSLRYLYTLRYITLKLVGVTSLRYLLLTLKFLPSGTKGPVFPASSTQCSPRVREQMFHWMQHTIRWHSGRSPGKLDRIGAYITD